MNNVVPLAALTGSLKDHRSPKSIDLTKRGDGFFAWQDLRRQNGLWSYARSTSSAPAAHCAAKSDSGILIEGINFASQDYLSLASHPRLKAAAKAAIDQFGVHSAGSGALLGNTSISLQLAERLSSFLGGAEIVLYPTGWGAGYGAIQGFVRGDDHIVIDILAHSCLQAGAAAATRKIHFHRHLDVGSIASKLATIRASDSRNAILVVTESLFSMHSDTPDLCAIRQICDTYGAALLVDCAHDIGCMGAHGLGELGEQGMMDRVDIVVGSFSKTFASNGGFVAVHSKASAEYLKYYSATHTFSNALSPVQSAIVLEALAIIQSDEGTQLRSALQSNVVALRDTMARSGRDVLGLPSPIVPVRVGGEALGRLVSRNLSDLGVIANLVEYPAVPLGQSRFRFQVMAAHSASDIDAVVAAFSTAMHAGEAEIEARRPAGGGYPPVAEVAPHAG